MRRAVRLMLEHADREKRCPGPESCGIIRKKGYCPDYCKCHPPQGLNPVHLFRYQRACATLLLIESVGLRFRDLEWYEIPDLMIVVTERNIYHAEKARQTNAEQQKNSIGGDRRD